jgi:hypothetical protein
MKTYSIWNIDRIFTKINHYFWEQYKIPKSLIQFQLIRRIEELKDTDTDTNTNPDTGQTDRYFLTKPIKPKPKPKPKPSLMRWVSLIWKRLFDWDRLLMWELILLYCYECQMMYSCICAVYWCCQSLGLTMIMTMTMPRQALAMANQCKWELTNNKPADRYFNFELSWASRKNEILTKQRKHRPTNQQTDKPTN